jgi:tRNA threonylcarbamoyladenosine biosynthesis protein TsaE
VIEMDFKITTYSEEETIELAQNIESEKFPNMVICLKGDLGSGKTVFTKGFAQALEVKEEVTSPTFNIIKEYTSGEMPLYHMDVYRLDGNVEDLGIEEYYTKKGITIIEWADMIPDYLPEKRLDIKIKSSAEDEDKRIITITPYGKKYEELCEAIL